MITPAEAFKRVAEEQRQYKQAVALLLRGVQGADRALLSEGIRLVEEAGAWELAMKAISRLGSASPVAQEVFLNVWVDSGDILRENLGSDLVLIKALRVLLPPYNGRPVTVYRGDSAWNRKRRTYGLSWSADSDIAEDFANGIWRCFEGGSVLLKTSVDAAAIVCAPYLHGKREEEQEYLIDRRYLKKVDVLRRYSFVSPEVLCL